MSNNYMKFINVLINKKLSQYNEMLSHNFEKVSHYYDLHNHIFLTFLQASKVYYLESQNRQIIFCV